VIDTTAARVSKPYTRFWKGFQFMFKPSANKIFLAASALLMCAGYVQAQTPASPLTAAPTSVSVSYSLATSTAGTAVPVTLTIPSGAGDAFVVNASTVPYWLAITPTSGTAIPAHPGPAVSISFNASAGASALSAGVTTANVGISVTGYADLVIPVSIVVSSGASSLSVSNGGSTLSSGNTVTLPYTYGSTTYPTATLSLMSSDDPIAFTLTSATTTPANTVDWIQLSIPSGLAYSYGSGTSVTITVLPAVLQNATVGETLAGSVAIAYGSTTFTVNISITVAEPTAAVTSIYPQEVPALATGSTATTTVVVYGSGFGNTGGYAADPTTVSVIYGSGPTTLVLTGTEVTIPNQNTLILKIPAVAIGTAAGTATISVTNGLNAEVAQTATLNVSVNPIISAIADAAALEEPAAGKIPNVAPYEIISIFGSNFCPTCTAPVVAPVVSDRYPTSLTAASNPLTVTFYKSDGVTVVGDAYLLFATNNQINALVPSGVIAADTNMQVVVSYNSLLSNTNVNYTVNGVSANPGIFTISSSGQGQGAILLANDSVNSATNTAAVGGTVLIYLSGLGTPTSTGAGTAAASAVYPTTCVSPANYVTLASLSNPATEDGAVIDETYLLSHVFAPCFVTAPTVDINGAPATVTYAGWVAGSVAGLYQINATVPTKAVAGSNSVLVTVGTGSNAVSSQAGVTMQVK
jgi:uncharacterized protein (TIGR03437 family)